MSNLTLKKLPLLWVFALAGWIVVIVQYVSLEGYKNRFNQSQNSEKAWKRQAGRAYTDLLLAKSGASSTSVLIPKGTQMECQYLNPNETGIEQAKTDCVLYPPDSF